MFFHPNGQRQMERHYTEGLEDGVFKQWASDGRLLGQFEMKAGTGTMMWWCENGTLSEQRGLKDGMEDGAVMRWSCDGVLNEKGQSVAGKREGEWQRFDGSGRLLARERYVGYELDGAASQLWPDRGQTRWDRTYVKGRLEGPTAWFDDAGRKFVEGTYRQGAPAGTWTAYFANGKKREEVVLDPKAPRSTTWDPDGIQSVVVEMDASWNVVRIDGKDARAACLTGWFNVQTDRIWESPMAFEARGRVPCSEVPPAADPGANGKGDSKKVVR